MDNNLPHTLRVGAARTDITPVMGTQLAGDIGRYRPAEVVVDPLYAHALVLESGGGKVCIVSLDLLAADKPEVAEIKRRAGEACGLAPEAILVHCPQSHSAPMMGHMLDSSPLVASEYDWLLWGDRGYARYAVDRAVQAIVEANRKLEPVRMGYTTAIEGRVSFNRRFVMRDGKARCHPALADPNIRYCEGPIDPELGVLAFTRPDLSVPALLLHFTCHPTHGYPMRWVSADWPGVWGDAMRKVCGDDCVPLVINGFVGNVHHRNHLDPQQVDDFRLMGQALAETTVQAMRRGMTFRDEAVVAHAMRTVRVPYRPIPQREVDYFEKLLADNPEPMWTDETRVQCKWDWVLAHTVLQTHARQQREGDCAVDVQVLRIGDAAIVAVPGEPFVEGQLKIKLNSPAFPTFGAHNGNQYWPGYIPTPHAIQRGGYEVEWAKLVPEALDTLADAAVAMLQELF